MNRWNWRFSRILVLRLDSSRLTKALMNNFEFRARKLLRSSMLSISITTQTRRSFDRIKNKFETFNSSVRKVRQKIRTGNFYFERRFLVRFKVAPNSLCRLSVEKEIEIEILGNIDDKVANEIKTREAEKISMKASKKIFSSAKWTATDFFMNFLPDQAAATWNTEKNSPPSYQSFVNKKHNLTRKLAKRGEESDVPSGCKVRFN